MNKIKVATVDCDGSLTDGGIYMFSNGLQARKFSTFDGEGVRLLRASGVQVVLVSQSNDTEIRKRAQWLDIPFHGDVWDKAKWATDYSGLLGISLCNFAHFGNDLNDLALMKICELAGCPADAHDTIKNLCWTTDGFISTKTGGNGAFREFAEFVIARNGSEDTIRLRRGTYIV